MNFCTYYILLVTCITYISEVLSISVLEIVTDGTHYRSYPNVSYGLGDLPNFQHQCLNQRYKGAPAEWDTSKDKKKYKMTFTPNRRMQSLTYNDALEQRLQTAVVLVVGGHSNSHYDYGSGGSINGLLAVWDSWVDNFFRQTSNTTSLVLVFDERDFRRQNISSTYKDYLNRILIDNMQAEPVECVKFRNLSVVPTIDHYKYHSHGHSHRSKSSSANKRFQHRTGINPHSACSNQLHLDSGYYLYYIDFPETTAGIKQKPLIIFATIYSFPKPDWAKDKDEEKLFQDWKPFRLNRRYPTNYGYVKLTNWYAYHQMNLQILDFFDYASKLDNDVSFVQPFPIPNPPLQLVQGQHYLMNTQAKWYHDDPRISAGVELCLWHYIKQENQYCAQQERLIQSELLPGGFNDSTFFETNHNTTFRAHFLVYWLGLYTAPEVKSLGFYWNQFHPWGMWDFRWGDQQWWPRPIAMFGNGNLQQEILRSEEINTENERYVVHKAWPRWMTIPKVRYFDPVVGTNKTTRERLYSIAAKSFK